MLAPERGKSDFWLWAAIHSGAKLVFSHRIGKRDWLTGNMFVEDVSNWVCGPVQSDEGLTTDVRISLTRKPTTASKKAVVKQKVVTK